MKIELKTKTEFRKELPDLFKAARSERVEIHVKDQQAVIKVTMEAI